MSEPKQPPPYAATAAARRGPEEIEWQRLWYSLRARQWQALAIVGIDGARLASEAANRLVAVARRDEKSPVEVISASGMSFRDTNEIASRLLAASTGPTLVVCDSPVVNPAMIPIVQVVAGVVIVVKLGDVGLEAIRQTVDAVGRDKVLATVTVG